MAGLYIHIPFCAKACYYCDFHFSTNLEKRNEVVKAIGKEIMLQKDYLNQDPLHTIYFGGGTPSLLSFEEISFLMTTVRSMYDIASLKEVTLEANPEDLSQKKLEELKAAGITRLSIGLQSFHDAKLLFLNRCHTAKTGVEAFKRARQAGFTNLNIDLIYAIPDLDSWEWEENIEKAIELDSEHISAYTLTIESNTVFGRWASKGKLASVPDDVAAAQMELLADKLEKAGYEHYEVSNFCKPGKHAIHNSNYWSQQNYLGVGPSAHSYNGVSRQFNVSNNHIYLRSLQEDKIPFQREELTRNDRINEYILTSLRTIKGCDLVKLRTLYNFDLLQERSRYVENIIEGELAFIEKETLKLTGKGRLLADKIASDLFEVAPE